MWPDESGNWGDLTPVTQWVDPTGTTPQNGAQVSPNDVLSQSTVSNGPDKYGGWFAGLGALADKAGSYLIARDAAKHGMVQTSTPNGQPAYQPSIGARVATGNGAAWLIGGAIVIGVLLVALDGKKG